eukprot:4883395-Ditylum_brightwellii.AAC.1
MSITPSILNQLGCDHTADIFSPDIKKVVMETMNKEEELVEHKELATFLFKESQCHAQTAKAHGKKACRYSPLMLFFVCILKNKLDAGSYDFVAKVFKTTSARQLNRYKGADQSTEDRVMGLTIQTMAQTITCWDMKWTSGNMTIYQATHLPSRI